jgi:hypothetical protein
MAFSGVLFFFSQKPPVNFNRTVEINEYLTMNFTNIPKSEEPNSPQFRSMNMSTLSPINNGRQATTISTSESAGIMRCNSCPSSLPEQPSARKSCKSTGHWSSPRSNDHDEDKRESSNASNDDKFEETMNACSPWDNYAPVPRPVERYHCFSNYCVAIDEKELPKAIVSLSEAFQKASCHCDLHQDRIYCNTLDGIKFAVSFTRTTDTRIAIELSRINGDSIEFHRHYAPYVLQVIRGETPPEYATEQEQLHGPLSRTNNPIGIFAQPPCPEPFCNSASTPFLSSEKQILEDALDIVGSMLNCDRYDSMYLGLESLRLLCDPCKSGNDTAQAVSKIVLTGSENPRNRKIQQFVQCLALTHRFWNSHVSTTTLHRDFDQREAVISHAYLAMNVLALAVANLADDSHTLTGFVETAEQLPRVRSVWDRLLGQINAAPSSPHMAYLAATILGALVHAANDGGATRSRILCHMRSLQHAHHIGTCSHAALQHASSRLLNELENTMSPTTTTTLKNH